MPPAGNAGPVTVTNNSAITTGNTGRSRRQRRPDRQRAWHPRAECRWRRWQWRPRGRLHPRRPGRDHRSISRPPSAARAAPAGTGGAVYVDNTGGGAITTYSSQSHGIIAQSVGGSGGNGGLSVDQTVQALASGSSSTSTTSPWRSAARAAAGAPAATSRSTTRPASTPGGAVSHGLFAQQRRRQRRQRRHRRDVRAQLQGQRLPARPQCAQADQRLQLQPAGRDRRQWRHRQQWRHVDGRQLGRHPHPRRRFLRHLRLQHRRRRW